MPFKSKLPRLVVNCLRNPNLGRYTGVDVTEGKVIRKDEDGRDVFEDYFTPEEDDDSDNEKTFALPTEVVNRIKRNNQVDVSIRSMSPFSPTSSVRSSISDKAISESVAVLVHSSTEKDGTIQEVTIQKEAQIIVCNSTKDKENLQGKNSNEAHDENQNNAINKSNTSLQSGLALMSLPPQNGFPSGSKERQQNTASKKQILSAKRTDEKVSKSAKSKSGQSSKQKCTLPSPLGEKNHEEVEHLKPRMSTFVYQLPPEDFTQDVTPHNLLYKGTANGSISKASFSRRSTFVNWHKKTKARLSFSGAYVKDTPKPEETKPRCEEPQEEPLPEESNNSCSSAVDLEQEIPNAGDNEDRQSCLEDNDYDEDIGTPSREPSASCLPPPTTDCLKLSDDESSEEDFEELCKPFRFSLSKKSLENIKKKEKFEENENNHLNEQTTPEKQRDEFNLTITPKPVSKILSTSDGYIIVNWKVKDKESRSGCSERPASTKQIIDISKLSCNNIENDELFSVSRGKKKVEEDYEKHSSRKKNPPKPKKDVDLRKGSKNKKKSQQKVDKDSDLSSIIEESVCGDYQQLDLESLPELTLTSEDEERKKKPKKKVISKRRRKKKEETRSQDSTADSAFMKSKVNKLENNQKKLMDQKMEEQKKEMEELVTEDMAQNNLVEDECFMGSPVIEIAPWSPQSSNRKTMKSIHLTKQAAAEESTLADNSTLSRPSCRGRRKLKESAKKNQTESNSSSLKATTSTTYDLVSYEIIGCSQKKKNNNRSKLKKSCFQGQEESKVAGTSIEICRSMLDSKLETLNESIPIVTETEGNRSKSVIPIEKKEKTKKIEKPKKLKSVLEDSSVVSPDISFGGNEEMSWIAEEGNRSKSVIQIEKEKKIKKPKKLKSVLEDSSVVSPAISFGENEEMSRIAEEQSELPKVQRKRNDSDWRDAEDSPLLRRVKKSNILASSIEEQREVDGETGEISSSMSRNVKKSPQKKNKQSYGVRKNRKSCKNSRNRRSSTSHLTSILKSAKTKRIKKVAKIVPPEETCDGNLRRSKRQKVRPLEFWKNERIEYRRQSSGYVIAGVISPKSPREEKRPKARTKRSQKSNDKPVNSSDLRKSFANNTPNQSIPHWIPETLSKGYVIPPNIQKFLEIVKKGKVTAPAAPVPVINPETKTEVEISCISVKDSHTYVNASGASPAPNESLLICRGLEQEAFSSGYLVLAPFAEKGLQFIQNDSMVFVVSSGEVLITIHETTGLVSEGDLFFVPCGNKYNIVNLQEKPAKLIYFRICCGPP